MPVFEQGSQLFHEPTIAFRIVQEGGEEPVLSSSAILRTTCKVYGSMFVVLFALYLLVRSRYPGVYNVKRSYPTLHIPIAEDFFGPLSWCWKVFQINHQDIADQCGMDAGKFVGCKL
jgi:hypothetical protein